MTVSCRISNLSDIYNSRSRTICIGEDLEMDGKQIEFGQKLDIHVHALASGAMISKKTSNSIQW